MGLFVPNRGSIHADDSVEVKYHDRPVKTLDKMAFTFRWEFTHRRANVDYWSGAGGITPPGGNNGFPSHYACMNGSPSLNIAGCNENGGVWYPDQRKNENLIDMDILVKF